MSRTSTLPKRLQPMLATLIDGPFNDSGWVFEDKYDGFRMVAELKDGKLISQRYFEAAKALEGVKGDVVIAMFATIHRAGEPRNLQKTVVHCRI